VLVEAVRMSLEAVRVPMALSVSTEVVSLSKEHQKLGLRFLFVRSHFNSAPCEFVHRLWRPIFIIVLYVLEFICKNPPKRVK
jgi:hypothetical protein